MNQDKVIKVGDKVQLKDITGKNRSCNGFKATVNAINQEGINVTIKVFSSSKRITVHKDECDLITAQ